GRGIDSVDGTHDGRVADGLADQLHFVAHFDGDNLFGKHVAFYFHGAQIAQFDDGRTRDEYAGVLHIFFEDGSADGRYDLGFLQVAASDGQLRFEPLNLRA